MKTDEYKKIIKFAVANEIEAYDFYKGVSDKVKDAGLKKIFAELAEEEAKHRKFLEGLTSGKAQIIWSGRLMRWRGGAWHDGGGRRRWSATGVSTAVPWNWWCPRTGGSAGRARRRRARGDDTNR